MEDIYSISDNNLLQMIGSKVKSRRLAQNITQANLAADSQVPVSTIQRIERGEIGSVNSLLRVMRVLGMLDLIASLVEEDQMSPMEYLRFTERATKKKRQRAHNDKQINQTKEESEW